MLLFLVLKLPHIIFNIDHGALVYPCPFAPVQAFNLMSSLGENPDIYPVLPMYNYFLEACVQMHSVNHASKCLDLMEKQMVGKNEVTYTELLKVCKANQFIILYVFGCNDYSY